MEELRVKPRAVSLARWHCSHRGVLAELGVFTLTGVANYARASRGAEMRARVSHPPNQCLVQYNIPSVLKRLQILIPK